MGFNSGFKVLSIWTRNVLVVMCSRREPKGVTRALGQVSVSVCPSVCLCLSVRLSVCVCLSVCLSVAIIHIWFSGCMGSNKVGGCGTRRSWLRMEQVEPGSAVGTATMCRGWRVRSSNLFSETSRPFLGPTAIGTAALCQGYTVRCLKSTPHIYLLPVLRLSESVLLPPCIP